MINTSSTDFRIVPPEGDPSSKICIIGEAPGYEEYDRPFTGPSGKLLDTLLASAGILRQECYITNVIKENLPSLKSVELFPRWNYYIDQLKTELNKTESNVIVAVGQTAFYATCGIKGMITKRRGGIYESTLVPGRKVIPIIHPSACLRGETSGWKYRYYIAFDLCRVNKEKDFPEIILPKRDLVLRPSFNEACEWISDCGRLEMIGFDIECVNLELYCFSISKSSSESICITLNDYNPDQELEIIKRLAILLEDKKVKKLGQNILFDTHFLFRKYGIVSKNLEDTMIAAGIIFPDFPKALWFLVSVYCDGERYYKSEGESFYRDDSESKNQREIKDPDSFRRYSAMDSAVLFDIYFKQMEELRRSGNVGPYNRTVRLIEPLIFAQERGILADVEGIISGKKQINDRIKELRSELNRLAAMNGVMNINWSSPDQLKEYFYIVKQEKPYFSRDKKSKEKKRKIKTVNGVEVDMTQWTINEEAKMRLARKGHKEAELLLEMTSLSKLDRTYMNVTLTEDGRFTCSFNPVGTVSGRLSSRKNIFGKGLNMQNLPKEYILDFVSSYLDFTE